MIPALPDIDSLLAMCCWNDRALLLGLQTTASDRSLGLLCSPRVSPIINTSTHVKRSKAPSLSLSGDAPTTPDSLAVLGLSLQGPALSLSISGVIWCMQRHAGADRPLPAAASCASNLDAVAVGLRRFVCEADCWSVACKRCHPGLSLGRMTTSATWKSATDVAAFTWCAFACQQA